MTVPPPTVRQPKARQLRAKRSFDTIILVIIGALLLLSGTDAIARLLNGGGNAPLYMLLVPISLLIVLFLPHLFRGAAAAPEITAVLALCILSLLWSYHPQTTFVRVIPLAVTTAFALMLASLMSLRQMLLFMASVASSAMLLSLIMVATVPGAVGSEGSWENTWRGIYNHKNGLGSGAILCIVTATGAAMITRGGTRRLFIAAALLGIFMLYQSESRTAQMVAVTAGGAMALALVLRRFPVSWGIIYILGMVTIVGTMAILISTGLIQPVFDIIERQPTLSGRIPLWGYLWPDVRDEFWLGYGYQAYWIPDTVRVRLIIIKALHDPFYSHNGMVETMLAIGVIGFSLVFMGIVRALANCFYALRHHGHDPAIFVMFILLTSFVMQNITEGSILSRASMQWMFFVMAAAKIAILGGATRIAWQREIASRREAVRVRAARATAMAGRPALSGSGP